MVVNETNGTLPERCSAVLAFAPSLIRPFHEAHIAPNYVGVRRVRPHFVKGFQREPTPRSETTFRVTNADGTSRRMNTQEKKAAKRRLADEKKESRKKRKEEQAAAAAGEQQTENAAPNSAVAAVEGETSSDNKYFQLEVNQNTLKEEMEDVQGGRASLPMMLSPPIALQARVALQESKGSDGRNDDDSSPVIQIQYDEELSRTWAQQLKESMLSAEQVRQGEDLRPMAYQLIPEVWTRLRVHGTEENSFTTTAALDSTTVIPFQEITKESDSATPDSACPWARVTCRPASRLDVEKSVLVEYLARTTECYLSCGAKFGSDYLIYDGPREERHAFAGLRMLPSTKRQNQNSGDNAPMMPIPTTYSLAGYVRTLNTAGKLALLATVVCSRDDHTNQLSYRIAIVDVALEKILNAPTHKRRNRNKKRREIGKSLAKAK